MEASLIQLFSATSTALQFQHRTETANSPLETQWGESASPELQHRKVSWKKTLPKLQGQEGEATSTCPASIHHPIQNPGKHRSKNAKIPVECAQLWLHSPREMLCPPSALSVSCSQECIQNIPWIESILCLWGAELLSKAVTHLLWP